MNLDKLKDAARRHELREEWRKAIEIYHRALEELSLAGEPGDPSLYNRIGDLELKAGDPGAALHAYEQAADTYADQGFFNNAIALCGKILRVSPNRTATFLRLADLHARKNVVAESRRNLQEFIERMLSANHAEQLKSALRTYSDRYSASAEFRSMLIELLGSTGRTEPARELLAKLITDLGLDTQGRHSRAPERRAPSAPATGGLVFLDTGIDIPGIALGGPSGEFAIPAELDDSFSAEDPAGTATVDNMPLPEVEPLPFMEPTTLDQHRSTDDLEPHVLSGFEPTQVGHEVRFPDFDSPLIIEERPDPLDIPGFESLPEFNPPVAGDLGFEPMSLDEESGLLSLDATESSAPSEELFDELSVEVDPLRLGGSIEELDAALVEALSDERWDDAVRLVVRLIQLEPESVPRHQKRVEIAYRSGNRQYLIDAYLSLAQALDRIGATENAGLVFQRVLEHDPGNPVATAGLAALRVGTTSPPRPSASLPGEVTAPPVSPPPESAPVRPGPAGGFVDLSQLILEPEPEKDTRMRIDQGEPQSQEDVDFRETLEQFKQGVEANLDATDFQAHYDLGIAFKEMGLLDEAIAQFQKALRAPDGRLKSSEALGIAFFEKHRFGIAEAVLSRAVDALPGADDEKIALIYWWGRALEAQQKSDLALRCYERALAVDITFLDLGERIQRLTAEHLK